MVKLFKSNLFLRLFFTYILIIFINLSGIFYVLLKSTKTSLQLNNIILIFIVIIIICTFLAFFFSRKIVEPINKLITATDDIISQNYRAVININTSSELEILINRFNSMQSIIKDREEELKKKNDALKVQTAEAIEASRLKSEFLANMSHELRTPLNSIIGFTTRVIKKTEDVIPKIQLDNLKIVKDEAYHLLDIINSILDYSKIEAGKMEIYNESFNLKELIDEVGGMIKVLIDGKPINYKENFYCSEFNVISDRIKVKQILLNLLSNASKYSDEGTIELSLYRKSEGYVINIKDEGIGIAKEDLKIIFEEFRQVDGSYTRKVGGTGLGLSITKKFVEMLDGKISVASALDKGSIFTVFLPFCPCKSDTKEEKESYVKKIMLVDDDYNVQRLYKQYLNEHGFDVIALNGKEEVAEEIEKIMPDLVLLDVMLPNKDGWEILNDVKNRKNTKEIPIIMISVLNEKTLAYKLNANEFLVKPVTQEELLEAIMNLIHDRNI